MLYVPVTMMKSAVGFAALALTASVASADPVDGETIDAMPQNSYIAVGAQIGMQRDVQLGVVVDGVSDVLMLQPAQISAAPQFGTAFSTEYLTGIGTLGERMLILVDIEKLMTSEEMALVEQAAA